jgi:protein-disulfide isomerase
MHDRLFGGDKPRLRQADLREYAEEIGVPPQKVVWPATQFVEDRVEADFNSGVRSGVRGTPTLFVDGTIYDGAVTVDGLLAALEGVNV